jgi:chromosome segregation ATPase
MAFRIFSFSRKKTIEEQPPRYDTIDDNNLEFHQRVLKQKKLELEQTKNEIDIIDNEINDMKQIKQEKELELKAVKQEMESVITTFKASKEQILQKQKKENSSILKMMEEENQKFITRLEELKKKQLESFETTKWIEENNGLLPLYQNFTQSSKLSKTELDELFFSQFEFPKEEWHILTITKKDMWRNRTMQYITRFGEEISAEEFYNRCKKSGFSTFFHDSSVILKNGRIIPCKCQKCLWIYKNI